MSQGSNFSLSIYNTQNSNQYLQIHFTPKIQQTKAKTPKTIYFRQSRQVSMFIRRWRNPASSIQHRWHLL
jgi:hypothetical protein